jgi:4-hydroxy-4-methyl-2-oxoglutarate aldolase
VIDRDRDWCDALRLFDSPTIANAIERFRVRDPTAGFASLTLRCQYPELPPMVGYAVTCTLDSTTPGGRRPSKLHDLLDLLAAAAKPAIVVCQSVGPDPLRTCFIGEVSALVYSRLGAVGVVTDAANRDREGIHRRSPALQVFSPGWVASHGNGGSIVDLDLPVSISGLVIEPGILLHGDANGLLTIPLAIAAALADEAARVRETERLTFRRLSEEPLRMQTIKEEFRH